MTFLLRGGYLITMDPARPQVELGSVLVEGSTISSIGGVDELDEQAARTGAVVIDATGRAVLPGLVNAHMHGGLLRGTAENLALQDWIEQFIDPAHRQLRAAESRAGSLLCYAESLLSGTTALLDLGRYPHEAVSAAQQVGIRLHFAPYAGDDGHGIETVETTRRYLARTADAPHPRIHPWVGLEHLTYASDDTLTALKQLADRYDLPFHTHACESPGEIEEAHRRYGHSPVVELYKRGLLGPRTVLAHCVVLDEVDRDLLAQTGAGVAHCPTSNLKLASGVADVPALRRAGVPVALGTDGEKENNSLSMFNEMKLSALLRKGLTGTPAEASGYEMLHAATRDAALMLGMPDAGALVPGYRADVITVRLDGPYTAPLRFGGLFPNVCEHLVFAAGRGDVEHVFVDGHHVVAEGRLTTIDTAAAVADANECADRLLTRVHGGRS